jgi:hypothetical protein
MIIMRIERILGIFFILSVAVVFSAGLTVSAQDNSALISQAIHDVGLNCANLALNTTCIAHGSVQRTTSSGAVSTTYSQVGDRASITTTHQIQTGPLDATTGAFGINVMRVQAGLSSTSDGVVFVAFGGTTLTNVGGAGQAVWQNIAVSIAPNSPVPFLLIQAPKNTPVTITVNGTPIEIHSTVLVWFTDGQIHITVVSGSVVVGGVTVNVCYTISAPIVNGVVGAFGLPQMGLFPSGIVYIGILPSNVMNYTLIAPVVSGASGVGGAQGICNLS